MIKEIPGYPGYYATSDGEILTDRCGATRFLPKRKHNGYYRVNIRDQQHPVRRHVEPVHKLILETFVGRRPPGYVCRHLNGIPTDNHLTNICWGTPQENARDAVRHGTASCLRRGEQAVASKLTEAQVKMMRVLYANGHSQKEIADAFSISRRHVNDIVNGRTWELVR